jgi:prepilin-type N-terminal cleavage/methylation domain-containing protein
MATSPSLRRSGRIPQRGFTLSELAVSIVILALIVGGILSTPLANRQQAVATKTRQLLNEQEEALLGYAAANGHLPCPAKAATDGQEDRDASGSCNKRYGFLPWVTLGTQNSDGWGRLFGYSVTPVFADAYTLPSISTTADITLKTRNDAGGLINLSNTDNLVVVVFSFGGNGYWGTPVGLSTAIADSSSANDDEDTNAGQNATSNGGRVFVTRSQTTEDDASVGGFDDMVAWVPRHTLLRRMISARQLPH